jgi:hypothetical protein
MNYTLITLQGKVYTFYIQALAEQFQQAYGGVVFTQQVLKPVDKSVADAILYIS